MDNTKLRRNHSGFLQVANLPSPSELQKHYADKYYQEGKGSYEHSYTAEELRYFQAKLEQRWAMIQRCRGGDPGRMLDVGCGEGYALAFFREKNWSVKGLDFSSAGVLSKNPGVKDALVVGDVFELLREEITQVRNYDVIWLQNVLEHVLDPVSLMASLRSLIAPRGVAAITVPNDFSATQMEALMRGHVKSEFWVAPPEHLSYFDVKSLVCVAEETGWECLEIMGDFPIDWFLFCPASNYVSDKNVGKAVHRARVELENLIYARPVDEVIDFWVALAKIGMGINLTAYLRPKGQGFDDHE